MAEQTAGVRPPAVAGQFYPASPVELKLQVEDMLARAPDAEVEGEVRGLIAPHAGYPYSGQTAAAAYRQVRGRAYDTVVVMAPSHREPCGGASIFPGEAYETPLGEVPVDREMAQALAGQAPELHLSMAGHRVSGAPAFAGPLRGEHAVEVQLPFLQVALPGLRILPIVTDSRALSDHRRLADALVRAAEGKDVLLVASSDLYHGHSYEACVDSDAATLGEIESFDPERFCRSLETGRVQACGGGPITALMLAARRLGADRARVVERTNSSDATGRRGDYVVGYGSVLFYKGPDESGLCAPAALTAADRQALGRIAREAIAAAVRGESPPEPGLDTPALKENRGAFVTLHAGGELRGCIGDVLGRDPLGATVQKMAVAAATRDPRFSPLSASELGALQVEISVLGRMRRIASPSEIEVGRHGLWVQRGRNHGLLLPQVAARQGWDRTEFLEQACRKALLPSSAWQHPDTEISVFSADVFSA